MTTLNVNGSPRAIDVDADTPILWALRDARAYRLAVEVHGAGAAQRRAATELGARQAQGVPQRPQDGCVGVDIDGAGAAVDIECGHGKYISSKRLSARSMTSTALNPVVKSDRYLA